MVKTHCDCDCGDFCIVARGVRLTKMDSKKQPVAAANPQSNTDVISIKIQQQLAIS
jgi:hypothetical protein